MTCCCTWWPEWSPTLRLAWWLTWGPIKKILADMEFDMVADKEVAKLTDMVAGHGGWLIGPKLF